MDWMHSLTARILSFLTGVIIVGIIFSGLLFNPLPLNAQTGTAALSWEAPTQNTDGTPLTDLAGYRIYWGTSPGSYTNSVQLDDPAALGYVVTDLSATTWYFTATAFNESGIESSFSNVASKTIGGAVPNPPSNLLTDPGDPTPAFTFLITRDRVALIEIGSVGPGVACDGSQSVNGHYLVPRSSVTFLGSVQPEAVFAACSPG